MLLYNRVIFEDNTTLIDFSKEINDIYANTKTFDYTVTDDYLYIGSELPFNHRWFDVSTVNAVTSAISSIEVWDGSAWNAAVDVIDGTSTGGKSLAQSGVISFTLDRNKSWGRMDTTEDIPALSTLKIYDMYWARIAWNATLTSSTALNYVGFKFSEDNDLTGYYGGDFARSTFLTAFKSGKTNWKEQHVAAAEEIARELIRKEIIWSKNQILDWRLFTDASVHKVAEIVYTAFGAQYSEQRDQANKNYHIAMNKKAFRVDKDEDGRRDQHEKKWEAWAFRQ